MKGLRTFVPIFFTLLLLVIGAYFPKLISQVADYQLEQDIVEREDAQVSLMLSETSDLFHSLNLFRNKHFQIKLEVGSNMTAEEVQQVATETLNKMIQSGFPNNNSRRTDPEVSPLLVSNNESPPLSDVFWQCEWEDTQDVLWIDDKSGKMIALLKTIESPQFISSSTIAETIAYQDQEIALAMANFCRSYYAADDVKLNVEAESADFSVYTLQLLKNENELSETVSISISLQNGLLFFNL